MKKKILAVILSVIIVLSIITFPVLAVIYENHTSGESGSANYAYDFHYTSETFTASSNHTVTGVWFKVGAKYVSGSYPVYGELWELSGGTPDITGILANGYINLEDFTIVNDVYNTDWEFFEFSSSVNITSGSNYAVVFDCETCDANNTPYILSDSNASDQYPSGINYRSIDNGVTWPTSYPKDDLLFQIDGGIVAPSVTTQPADNVTYNSFLDGYDASFHFDIDNDGGENTTASIKYTTDNLSYYILYESALAIYPTADNYTIQSVTAPFADNETYWYFIQGCNSAGCTNGDVLSFSPEQENQLPQILTLNYPIDIDTDNLTAKIYGQVWDDGAEDVTGYFYWRELGSANWTDTISTATTNLSDGDLFNTTLTGLSLDTGYEFQASGNNSLGQSLGGIASFTMLEVSYATIATLPATNITSTEADLGISITDLGNDNNLTYYFEYRPYGSFVWSHTPWLSTTSTGNFYQTLSGLTYYSQYEFRGVSIAGVLGGESYYTYGDVFSFHTLSENTLPIIVSQDAVYLATGVVGVDILVQYDGGSPVILNAEYRKKGASSWTNTNTASNITTGYFYTFILSGLEDKTSYQYRGKGTNTFGTGYGSIREFYIDFTSTDISDDTDGTPDTDIEPLDMLNAFLGKYGLANSIGYWIALIVLMALSFMFFSGSNFMKILMPLLVLGVFIVAGLVDQWLVILLAIPAGLIIVFIIKKVTT